MRFRRLAFSLIVASTSIAPIAGAAESRSAQPCTLDRATGTTIDREPFLRNAYGMRWNAATNRLAYMQPGADGYYRLFTMRPDGSDRHALTDGRDFLPRKHKGAAYWHPSGRYLIFTAQKQDWSGRKLFGIPDYEALPGFGLHDDIWWISADGSRGGRLTDEPDTADEGVLLPVISPDGRRIAWASRQPGKTYVLKVGDLVPGDVPRIERVRSYAPGGAVYYEPGSFTSDSHSLMYTSDQDTHNFWLSQIYRLDLRSGKGVRLTTGITYNEHPTVVKSPSGDWVVFMSTRGVKRAPGRLVLGTDWYAVRVDGTGAKRLTTMNAGRPGDPENFGQPQVAGTVAVSPSGAFMLGDVQDSLMKQTGLVRRVRFTCGSLQETNPVR